MGRKAYWEPIVNPYGELEEFICQCGRRSTEASTYCPNCGAEMDNSDIEERIEKAKSIYMRIPRM